MVYRRLGIDRCVGCCFVLIVWAACLPRYIFRSVIRDIGEFHWEFLHLLLC